VTASLPRPRPRGLILGIVVAIGIVVVVAGFSLYGNVGLFQNGSPYPPPPSGWATFDTAWTAVASDLAYLGGHPWTVDFAEGAAADSPWSPPLALWALFTPNDWTPCEQQLNGVSTLTFWNASEYPYSTASDVYTSGSAPLWTFVFNGTYTPTFVASWVAGNITLNGVLGSDSPCRQLSPFYAYPYSAIQPWQEIDSNDAVHHLQQQIANWNAIPPFPGELQPIEMPTPPAAVFALYFPGQEFLPAEIFGAPEWSVAYGSCGFPGDYGPLFNFTTWLLNATSGYGDSWFEGSISCYNSEYQLGLLPTPLSGNSTSPGLYREWSVQPSFYTSAVPANVSLTSLTTSWVRWQLQNGSLYEPPIAPAAAGCGPADPELSNCPAPPQGWYAVLLSSTGVWLDSYPSVANGTAWTVADVPIGAGDRVVFVGAAGLSTSDVLSTAFNGDPIVWGVAGNLTAP